MANVVFGQSFTNEYVPQMSVAVRAENLGTTLIRIRQSGHGSLNFIIEGRPATVAVELVVRLVQSGVAASAYVRPVVVQVRIFTGEPWFSALFQYHVLLKLVQLIVLCRCCVGGHGFFLSGNGFDRCYFVLGICRSIDSR